MLFSMGIFFGQELEFNRPDILSQTRLIFDKAGIDIPEVDLVENISLSDTTGIISNSIVFHSQSNPKLNPGYYYWSDDMWNPLIEHSKGYELLVLWELDSNEFSYSDIDGSILTFGIGGIENAQFDQLKEDEKTLSYHTLGGKELDIDFNEVIHTEEMIKTFVLTQKNISFYNNGIRRRINFERAPKKQEVSVVPLSFHQVAVRPVELEIISGLNNFIADKREEAKDPVKEEMAEISQPTKKTREGHEIKSIEDNEDGTFTITYADGSRFTSLDLKNPKLDVERELVTVINNGDGTFTAMFSDGTSLSSKELHDFYNFEGYAAGDEPEVDVVIDNGDGTYDVIMTNGVELTSIDFTTLNKSKEEKLEEGRGILSVLNRDDGTFDVIFTDGTEINSNDLSDLKEYNISAFLPDEENEAVEDNETEDNEGDNLVGISEENTETSKERGIQQIEAQDNGSSRVTLTDGTTFSIPGLKQEDEAVGPDPRIEELIDHADGTYTIILTGGITLSSLEIPNLTSADAVSKESENDFSDTTDEDEEELESESVIPEKELPGEREEVVIETEAVSNEEDRVHDKNTSVMDSDKEENEVPIIERVERKKGKTQTDSSEIQGKEESYQERIIRIQREEIEALKKREEEKERELQEMNKRLKRLEELFDED